MQESFCSLRSRARAPYKFSRTGERRATGQEFTRLGTDSQMSRHAFHFSARNNEKSSTSKKPLAKCRKGFQRFSKYFTLSADDFQRSWEQIFAPNFNLILLAIYIDANLIPSSLRSNNIVLMVLTTRAPSSHQIEM